MMFKVGLAILLVAYSLSLLANEPPLIVEQPHEFEENIKPDVDIPDSEALSTAESIDTIRVEHVQFQGGTVFDLASLAAIVQPIIGNDVTKTDLVKVLRRITQKYKEAGYPLAFALLPKQNTQDGSITITLVEGYIARSEILIEDTKVKKRVEQLAAQVHDQIPLQKATFERYASLIENIPGYTFKILVPKPKTVNGATTIRVEQVKRDRIETNVGFDYGETEDRQIVAGLRLNTVTSGADELNITTLVPNDTVDEYYALNYSRAIGMDGLQIDFDASRFTSQGNDRIFIADVPINYEENKKRDRLAIGLRYPVKLTKSEKWWLGTKLHHADEESFYKLSRQDGSGSTVDIEKALRYSAIELNSQWQKKYTRQLVSVSARLKQGLELGSNRNQFVDAAGTREGAETTHFTSWDITTMWRFLVSPQWRLQARTNLFWSDDVLPSAEQARYGGSRFARAYPDGQAQGDRGAGAEVELRYLFPVNYNLIKRLEPYILFDVAKTQLQSNDNQQELASAVIGLDVTDQKYYGIGLELAKPIGDAHYETENREPIYNLKIRWKF
ncbi:ShlB/FhaC/HecB family hemolysin secretion/activation protein [Methylophaga thiooxydans]|uniref:ShlB/FhaC/HecB family hemolysin secretion/activation protein n=1 Tax=Methylophaga thiooxydans TaxID=392484 RepID=UPI002352DF22|nr:POTRA domain-containing protein [Methylophaga thiooxydans]